MADFLERTGSAEDEVVLDGVGVVQAQFDRGAGGDLEGGLIESELVGDGGDVDRDEVKGVNLFERPSSVAEGGDGIEQGEAVLEGGGAALRHGGGL